MGSLTLLWKDQLFLSLILPSTQTASSYKLMITAHTHTRTHTNSNHNPFTSHKITVLIHTSVKTSNQTLYKIYFNNVIRQTKHESDDKISTNLLAYHVTMK